MLSKQIWTPFILMPWSSFVWANKYKLLFSDICSYISWQFRYAGNPSIFELTYILLIYLCVLISDIEQIFYASPSSTLAMSCFYRNLKSHFAPERVLTRAPTGVADIRPPRRFFVDNGKTAAQRREIWHDYSFILFTHYVQVVTS